MPDKYNITTLIPTHSPNEVSARLMFGHATMNTELLGGAAIFQTIDDHWQLSTSVRPEGGNIKLIFNLHFKIGLGLYKVPGNMPGSVEWKQFWRPRQSIGAPGQNSTFQGTVTFNLGSDSQNLDGIVCAFESGIWGTGQHILANPNSEVHLEFTIHCPPGVLQYRHWRELQFNSLTSCSFKIGRLLLDPAGGDVVFVVRGAGGNSSKRLYAYKGILTGNSEYFAASLKPEWRNPEQTQRRLRTPQDGEEVLPDAVSSTSRMEIYLDQPEDDIDFVTLHNILYFIYIGCVNLPFLKDEKDGEPLPEGYPEEADPFRLFRAADKFLLPSLQEQCYFHLQHGVTIENVSDMLFHPNCEHHRELKQHFTDYIVANFKKVKETEGWERAVCDEDVSPAIYRYRFRLILEITKKVGDQLSKLLLKEVASRAGAQISLGPGLVEV